MVNQNSVKLIVDCQEIEEKMANPPGNITTNGYESLGKLVKSRGPKGKSAAVSGVHFIVKKQITFTTVFDAHL